MENRDTANAIIYVPSLQEILLQKKTLDYPGLGAGGWFNFGGCIEPGERPYQALLREIKEELGLELRDFEEIDKLWSERYEAAGDSGMANMFGLQKKERDLADITIGEGAGVAYFHKSEIPNVQMNHVERAWMNRFLESQKW